MGTFANPPKMKATKEMRFIVVLVVFGIFLSLVVSAETILIIGDSHTDGAYAQITGQAITEQAAPAVARRGGAAASVVGTPTAGTSPTGTASSCTEQQCREIDEVWQKSLGFFIRGNDEIWNVAASVWQRFTVMYPTTISPGTFVSGERPTGVCVASARTPEQRALLDTIAWAEGTANIGDNGYNVLVKGDFVRDRDQQSTGRYYRENNNNFFQGYQSHPNILINFRQNRAECTDREDSPCSTAAGRYQLLYGNYKNLKDNNNLFSAGFSPKEQDEAALYLISKRRVTTIIIDNAINRNDFVPLWDLLAPEWASLPCDTVNVEIKGKTYCTEKGKSFYGQRVKLPQELQQQFEKCLQEQRGRAS